MLCSSYQWTCCPTGHWEWAQVHTAHVYSFVCHIPSTWTHGRIVTGNPFELKQKFWNSRKNWVIIRRRCYQRWLFTIAKHLCVERLQSTLCLVNDVQILSIRVRKRHWEKGLGWPQDVTRWGDAAFQHTNRPQRIRLKRDDFIHWAYVATTSHESVTCRHLQTSRDRKICWNMMENHHFGGMLKRFVGEILDYLQVFGFFNHNNFSLQPLAPWIFMAA